MSKISEISIFCIWTKLKNLNYVVQNMFEALCKLSQIIHCLTKIQIKHIAQKEEATLKANNILKVMKY